MASRLKPYEAPRKKRPRLKKQSHLEFIRTLPCAVCGGHYEIEAAHIRMGSLRYGKQETGTGRKPDDSWTVPLCREHHRKQHTMSEHDFWCFRLDPFIIALALWKHSGDYEAAITVLRNAR
jgi:hypothetical protein